MVTAIHFECVDRKRDTVCKGLDFCLLAIFLATSTCLLEFPAIPHPNFSIRKEIYRDDRYAPHAHTQPAIRELQHHQSVLLDLPGCTLLHCGIFLISSQHQRFALAAIKPLTAIRTKKIGQKRRVIDVTIRRADFNPRQYVHLHSISCKYFPRTYPTRPSSSTSHQSPAFEQTVTTAPRATVSNTHASLPCPTRR